MREGAAATLCGLGLFFSLTGAVGMVRMPDLYTRVQCSSKTVTLGLIPLLIGLVIAAGPITPYGSRALFVGALVLLINPAASIAIVRAAYKTGIPMWDGAVLDEPRKRRRRRGKR